MTGKLFVYVIGPKGGTGPVKVGVASNVERRLKEIHSHSPVDCEVYFATRAMKKDAALAVETRAHDLLTAFSMRGEWFRCSPEVGKSAVKSAKAYFAEHLHGWTGDRVETALEILGWNVCEAERQTGITVNRWRGWVTSNERNISCALNDFERAKPFLLAAENGVGA